MNRRTMKSRGNWLTNRIKRNAKSWPTRRKRLSGCEERDWQYEENVGRIAKQARAENALAPLVAALEYADNCCMLAGVAPDDAPRSKVRAAIDAARAAMKEGKE